MKRRRRSPNFATSSPPAKTSWRSKDAEPQALTPTSPLRHGNQGGSLSERDQKLLAVYEENLRTRYAARTVEHYSHNARAFVAWLAGQGLQLKDARADDLRRYQSGQYVQRRTDGQALKPGTISLRLVAVRVLFRFLVRHSYVLFDPSHALELPRMERHLPRVILSEQEARRIVARPRAKRPLVLRDRAILETLYATGIRANELIQLRLEDVDTEERVLRVRLGKGKKSRNVPLTPAAVRALDAYRVAGRGAIVPRDRDDGWLFTGVRGRKLCDGTLGRIVDYWTKQARVAKHVRCHTFRHSVATHLLRGRADIRHIQKLLGHRQLSTTERYTHVEIQDLQRVVARAHPRGR